MTRGPTAPAPLPPADLASRPLPLLRWEGGATIVRIHRQVHGPMHFSPGLGKPPLGRFDSASGRFGVLYAAQAFEGAFVETLIRNPARILIGLAEIEARARSVIAIHTAIQLVALTGPGLSRLGLDARFLSGPYDPCGAWADALHDHPSRPAGIAYPSRFDPSQLCVALFARLAPHLAPATEPIPLCEMWSDVALILDRYRKALDPG